MSPAKALWDRPVELREEADSIRVIVAGLDTGLRLRPVRYEVFTVAQVEEVEAEGPNVMVRFRRASLEARRLLQEKRIPYASDAGEIFVLDPPVAIHETVPRRSRSAGEEAVARSDPFATKASRVSRWLLNHASETFSVRELAYKTSLSEGSVSQTVRQLHDRMLIEVARHPQDARVRQIQLEAPGALLDAWARSWERRRLQVVDWDLGSASVARTLDKIRDASAQAPDLKWAVGGTAGAATIVRAVEPADALVWIERGQLPRWEQLLYPAPGRGRRGTLRLAVAPDPFMLDVSTVRDGLTVADPAQLYLDSVREGERSLEAADAIRRLMDW